MDMMRITAMIFVMVFHINYYSIGLEEGTAADYSTYQLLGFSLMKCVSMVCVNMFILISGWYSIKPTVRGLIKLTFQIWFFSIPTYLCIVFLYDDTVFSLNILLHLLIFGGYWFIPAYLLLYICSPILNSFVRHASQRTYLFVLLMYWLFMFLYGWIGRETYFDHGCSPLVFFALYLTARYLKLYPNWLSGIGTKRLVSFYICILLTSSLLCTFITINYGSELAEMLMQYISPFNVGLSILLLLLFSKIKMQNSLINKIGISCFSAYLLHASPFFYEKIYYPLGCYSFHLDSFWKQFLFVVGLITALFSVSVLLDQIRIVLWRRCERMYSTKKWVSQKWE